ncbi:MAG: hypothetical protein HGA78_04285 [Nitrospirales bacterium]|nr:hypothetical protein [Nitrospirales bacterium]
MTTHYTPEFGLRYHDDFDPSWGTAQNQNWIDLDAILAGRIGTIPHAKAQLINALYEAVSDTTHIKGLWLFDQTGAGTTISDRGPLSHDVTLSANASTLEPDLEGYCRSLNFNASGEYWDTPDHADFSFGNGAVDSVFSIVALAKITGNGVIAGKADYTTAATQIEWELGLNASGQLYLKLHDDSAGAYISRYCSATEPLNTWEVLIGKSSATGVSGLKLYRGTTQVDDTNDTSGTYIAMENKTAKVGSYITNTSGAKAQTGNVRLGALMIVAEDLETTARKRLDMILKGYAGVEF